MSEDGRSPQSNTDKEYTDKLWREYEACQKAAQNLESIIWQTSGVIGIGSVGTLILVANHPTKDQPSWWVALIIGLSIFLFSIIWLFMARRWWSIQHAFFIRMRHIEERLNIYATRYLHYLDNPYALPESRLPKRQRQELRNRAEQRGLFRRAAPSGAGGTTWLRNRTEQRELFRPHQRAGIQRFLIFLPVIILIAWVSYVVFLYCIGHATPTPKRVPQEPWWMHKRLINQESSREAQDRRLWHILA